LRSFWTAAESRSTLLRKIAQDIDVTVEELLDRG
jgi:hypothetical protein